MPTLQKKESKNAKVSTSRVRHTSSEADLLYRKMRQVVATMNRRAEDLMDAAELVKARIVDEGKKGLTVNEVRARLGLEPID